MSRDLGFGVKFNKTIRRRVRFVVKDMFSLDRSKTTPLFNRGFKGTDKFLLFTIKERI